MPGIIEARFLLLPILGSLLLSACDGGDSTAGSSNFVCSAVEGVVQHPCASCSNVQNSDALGDGDINSAATYETYHAGNLPNSGQITFIVDKTGDGTYPAGGAAGIALQLPRATGVSYTLTPSIRLNGAPTQTGDPVTISGNTDGEFHYVGLGALSDFDGVQMNLQYSEPVGATEEVHRFRLFEACADGSLRP